MVTRPSTHQEVFISNLDSAIENYLADTKFNVKRLLRIVGMSRTDLHRKLKEKLGMSATEYIRHYRISKAAQMLINQPEKCIGQVALEVGFSNQSYFTKRFRELFGVCPASYKIKAIELEHMS